MKNSIGEEKSKELRTELFNLLMNSNFEKAQEIINTGVNINEKGQYGNTLLSNVCGSGKLTAIEFLIKQGATAKGDFQALNNACWNNHLEIAEFLIKNGADVNDKNQYGNSLLSSVCGSGKLTAIEFLIKQGATAKGDFQALSNACLNNHFEIAEFLIKNGADVNCKDQCGNTVPHFLYINDKLEMLSFVINKDFDLNSVNNNGETVLRSALWNNKFDAAKILLENGAKLDENNGIDTLHTFCNSEKFEVLEFLFERGIDVDVKDNQNCTPLYNACRFQKPQLVAFLLKNGANISILNDQNNQTCLQIATEIGNLEIVSLINSAKAAGSLLAKASIETLIQFFKDNCTKMEVEKEVLIQNNVEIIMACAQRLIKNSLDLRALQQNCFNLDKNLKMLLEEGIEAFQPLFKFATSSLLKLNCLDSLNSQLKEKKLNLSEKEKSLIKLSIGTQEELLKASIFSNLFENLFAGNQEEDNKSVIGELEDN